ncbi:hypothetical protein TSUD_180820 [Trifolium subterraneum]|uniref:Uncharacterized protein n=1 Tax=Trifolium subterraneum TaxID=3900 RepID=A0A2Z6PJL8_TRISU|nr:hypothetical protein TSUD_180820 [Trifolium subterraneum]
MKENENEAKAKPEQRLALLWLVEQKESGGTTEAEDHCWRRNISRTLVMTVFKDDMQSLS